MRLRDAVHSDLASRENIDKKIRKHVEHFTNIAARAIQQGMQGVTAELDFDIGYMFKRQPAFKRGISVLKATCPLLTYFFGEKSADIAVDSRYRCVTVGHLLLRP